MFQEFGPTLTRQTLLLFGMAQALCLLFLTLASRNSEHNTKLFQKSISQHKQVLSNPPNAHFKA